MRRLDHRIENTFLGAVTENYVAQALRNNRYGLYYWTNEGTAELDFVLQKGDDIAACAECRSAYRQMKNCGVGSRRAVRIGAEFDKETRTVRQII